MRLTIFIAFLFASISLEAQKKPKVKVPKSIKETYNSFYFGIPVDRWDNDFEGSYTAFFVNEGLPAKASFAYNGDWLYTSSELSVENYATCVVNYIDKNHKESLILNMEYLEDSENTEGIYRVVLKTNGNNSEYTSTKNDINVAGFLKLTFNKKCKLINKEII